MSYSSTIISIKCTRREDFAVFSRISCAETEIKDHASCISACSLCTYRAAFKNTSRLLLAPRCTIVYVWHMGKPPNIQARAFFARFDQNASLFAVSKSACCVVQCTQLLIQPRSTRVFSSVSRVLTIFLVLHVSFGARLSICQWSEAKWSVRGCFEYIESVMA